MKSLRNYIDEKLIINQNYNSYTCTAKSFDELRKIIEQRYKEQGPGTKKNPIDFNDVDVSDVDTFNDKDTGLFERKEFEYIDISDWNVSGVQIMNHMFYNCEKLKSVGDLSDWVVSSVENMNYMFSNCEKLESVGNLSKWDVSGVIRMHGMFKACPNLKSVGDLSNWNTLKLRDAAWMFTWCFNLTSVGDLSKWDISNVKDMSYMFDGSRITNIPSWYKK